MLVPLVAMITEDLEITLNEAFEEASRRKHEFITLEHLLLALTNNKVAANILYHCGASLSGLKSDLERFLKDEISILSKDGENVEPQYTIGVQLVLQTAAAHVQSSGKNQMNGGHVLVALFRERESHAVYFLEQQGVTRFDVVRYISHQVSKTDSFGTRALPDPHADDVKESSKDLLDRYCVNLNAQVLEGKIDPLIGREKELDRTIHILARRRKNNPIFVGDAGVGKTAMVEGLAHLIVKKKVPACLEKSLIYKLDMASLLAGTKFRGEFEERLKDVIENIKNDPNKILFIDEIHTIIGAGAVTGGSLDASNILKAPLSSGFMKCIGTTTFKEYRQVFEKDHALSRRFQKVEVKEPSVSETIEILRGLKKRYEEFHRVQYTQAALKVAAELAAKHIHDRHLPDKAIDVMDEAGAEVKLRNKKDKEPRVTPTDIEKVVSRVAMVPTKTVQVDDKKRLKDLTRDLKLLIYGQDRAIDQVVQAVQLSRAGLGEPDKPIGSFLFSGPTGVGKTELAKQLAHIMGIEFIRFDMSEYMEKHAVSRLIGSPPGYVGYEEGGQLTEAINRNPHAVLLLDEMEKSHEDIFNILLQVMDHAVLTDNNGRKANFRQIILIMTTNVGARDSQVKSIGFKKDPYEDKSQKAIEKAFNPEFRNRLTSIVQFNPLEPVVIEQIVEKMMSELEERLKKQGISIFLEPSARKYLAEKGFDRQFGARPIRRLIENEISQVLSQEILFGQLKQGGQVVINCIDDKLKFAYQTEKVKEQVRCS